VPKPITENGSTEPFRALNDRISMMISLRLFSLPDRFTSSCEIYSTG